MRHYLSDFIHRGARAFNGISTEPEAKLGEPALIVQRDARDRENGTMSWMIALDARALALKDCGCGLPVIGSAVYQRMDQLAVELIFLHDRGLKCKMAFDCSDHYKPLTYGQYCKLMEIESDEEDDG